MLWTRVRTVERIQPFGWSDEGRVVGNWQEKGGEPVAVLVDTLTGERREFRAPGCVATHGRAVNWAGHIVGYGVTESGDERALLWVEGEATDLGPGRALDLNDAGEVVGQILEEGQPHFTRAALWRDGAIAWLGPDRSLAERINRHGRILGFTDLSEEEGGQGVVWTEGVARPLPLPKGGTAAFGHDLNDEGWVVGVVYHPEPDDEAGDFDEEEYRGMLWRGDVGEPIRVGFWSDNGGPQSINDHGLVAGVWLEALAAPPTYVEEAFLWRDGKLRELSSLAHPWVEEQSHWIRVNNRNEILIVQSGGVRLFAPSEDAVVTAEARLREQEKWMREAGHAVVFTDAARDWFTGRSWEPPNSRGNDEEADEGPPRPTKPFAIGSIFFLVLMLVTTIAFVGFSWSQGGIRPWVLGVLLALAFPAIVWLILYYLRALFEPAPDDWLD